MELWLLTCEPVVISMIARYPRSVVIDELISDDMD
jgi:hypothetical protein